MTLMLVCGGRYDRRMGQGLPTPAYTVTVAELERRREQVYEDLRAGGAVLVVSNDRRTNFGVLTQDPAVLGDAELAQQIEAERIPPLAELLAEPADETQPA